jgi:hypothetical protein
MADTVLKRWRDGDQEWEELNPQTTHTQIVATGTPSASTYLRGDGSWSSLPTSENYDGWDLYVNNLSQGRISSGENVNFVAGTNVSLGYSTTNNSITINSTGDITGVTAGSGLSGGGTSGTVTLTVDPTEINTSDLNNDAGWTSNAGDITSVAAGTGLNGGGTAGAVTLNLDTAGPGAGWYGSTLDSTKVDRILLDDYGRVLDVTTGTVGDITGVTAGSGLTGGGTSGSVTLSHADTSSQASVNNSGTTFIQDITLDTYGHITAITSADAGGGGGVEWNEIKTGITTISSGTAVTTLTLNEAVDDTTVIAFELNTSTLSSYTSQIFTVRLENSSSTASGILYNAYASSTLMRVGSVRVYRGATSTQLNFSYSYYFSNGSSSETADTIYVGKVWKLEGVTGS